MRYTISIPTQTLNSTRITLAAVVLTSLGLLWYANGTLLKSQLLTASRDDTSSADEHVSAPQRITGTAVPAPVRVVAVSMPSSAEPTPSDLRQRVEDRRETRLQQLLSPMGGRGEHVIEPTHAASNVSLLDMLGMGSNGQVLTIKDGKIVWASPNFTGTGKLPSQLRGNDSRGGETARRGGGGSAPPESADGKLEGHDHQSNAGGGVLDINNATAGVLAVSKGGTGTGSFAMGDLLVGLGNGGLSRRSIGSAGQVLISSGGTVVWSDTVSGNLTQTSADARYVNASGDTMSGALMILATGVGIDVKGTMSGNQLYVAASVQGAGLTDCDASKQVLKWDATTGRFNCGTASTFGSGNVLTIGESRYVNVTGDTMTGTLILTPASGLALNARGTISGSLVTQNGAGLNYFMGNLGIGTTSPSKQLEVAGALSLISSNGTVSGYATYENSDYFTFRKSNGAGALVLASMFGSVTGGEGVGMTLGSDRISLGVNNTILQLIDAGALIGYSNTTSPTNGLAVSGNVGIGTTAPKAKLDVVGTISGSALVVNGQGKFLGGDSALAGVTVYPTTNYPYGFSMYRLGSTSTPAFSIANDGADGTAFTAVNAPMTFVSNGEKFRVLAAGGVSILGPVGAPTSALAIAPANSASLRISLQNLANTTTQAYMGITSANYEVGGAAENDFYISNINKSILFSTDNGTTAHMAIKGATGLVGIGTTSPDAKLDVVGTISGSLITQNGAGLNYFMGNVGIGTTTPSAELEILSTSSWSSGVNGNLRLSSANYPSMRFYGSAFNNASAIWSYNGQDIRFAVNGTGDAYGTSMARLDTVGLGIGGDFAPKTRLEVLGTISGSTVLGSNGITTKVISGACSDSNAQATNGTICIDSTNGRIYFRYGGAWHYAAQTAGFQIPKLVRNGKDETEGLEPGDLVIGQLDERMEDGALHGVWIKFDLQNEISQTLAAHPELLTQAGQIMTGEHVTLDEIRDLTLQGSLTVYGNTTLLGDLTVRGTLSLDSKQAGETSIAAGGTEASVQFVEQFGRKPIITATVQGGFTTYALFNATADGFTIRLREPAQSDLTFSWLAIPTVGSSSVASTNSSGGGTDAAVEPDQASPDAAIGSGSQPLESDTPSETDDGSPADESGTGSALPGGTDESEEEQELMPFPVDSSGAPVSSSDVWNNCIRNIPTLADDGIPFECGRYHEGFTWEHPDSLVRFGWNTHMSPPLLTLPEGYETVVQE